MENGMELLCSPSTLLSKQQHVFINLGALPTLSIGVFLRQDLSWFFLRFSWDKTIHRQDWLPDCHWPLAAELTSSLSPHPGGGAESQSFNHRSVPLASCPQPWKSQGHEPRYMNLVNITRDTFLTLILKNFRSYPPETGTKTKSVFSYYLSQYHSRFSWKE